MRQGGAKIGQFQEQEMTKWRNERTVKRKRSQD